MSKDWTGIGLGLGGCPLLRRGSHIGHRRKQLVEALEDVDDDGNQQPEQESEPEEGGGELVPE